MSFFKEKTPAINLSGLPIDNRFDLRSQKNQLFAASHLCHFKNWEIIAQDPTKQFIQVKFYWTNDRGKTKTMHKWLVASEIIQYMG